MVLVCLPVGFMDPQEVALSLKSSEAEAQKCFTCLFRCLYFCVPGCELSKGWKDTGHVWLRLFQRSLDIRAEQIQVFLS